MALMGLLGLCGCDPPEACTSTLRLIFGLGLRGTATAMASACARSISSMEAPDFLAASCAMTAAYSLSISACLLSRSCCSTLESKEFTDATPGLFGLLPTLLVLVLLPLPKLFRLLIPFFIQLFDVLAGLSRPGENGCFLGERTISISRVPFDAMALFRILFPTVKRAVPKKRAQKTYAPATPTDSNGSLDRSRRACWENGGSQYQGRFG